MAEGEPKSREHMLYLLNKLRGDMPLEVVHEGVKLPWMVSEKALVAIKEYDIRDDDVWIITYPKAGTHWACEIVNLILSGGDEDKIDRKKQPKPIEFDLCQPGIVIPPDFPSKDVGLVPFYELFQSWPSPRVFMTHLPEHLLPRQIYEGKGKVIFVIRNPKDTAVSMWNFLRPTKDPLYQQWDGFFDLYCREDFLNSSWFTFVLQFWGKHRNDENFLFLKYEDMKRDHRVAVVQIADFIGRHLSDEVIDRIVTLSTVGSMKQRFNTQDEPTGKPKIGAPGIIRKGIVGDWKTQFTVAQNEAFDKMFNERMEGSGLHIDF